MSREEFPPSSDAVEVRVNNSGKGIEVFCRICQEPLNDPEEYLTLSQVLVLWRDHRAEQIPGPR